MTETEWKIVTAIIAVVCGVFAYRTKDLDPVHENAYIYRSAYAWGIITTVIALMKFGFHLF